MPCSYCKRAGCSRDTCPERLEDYYGTPADRSETAEEMDEGHWVDYDRKSEEEKQEDRERVQGMLESWGDA